MYSLLVLLLATLDGPDAAHPQYMQPYTVMALLHRLGFTPWNKYGFEGTLSWCHVYGASVGEGGAFHSPEVPVTDNSQLFYEPSSHCISTCDDPD